ncbi:photosystem II reaction center PsbP [Parathermosynechococcus lividus]
MGQRFLATVVAIVVVLLTGCTATSGLQAFVDSYDGYQFLYPRGWVQVQVDGPADVVFHDIIQTTENVSVVVNSVSSTQSLEDLGSPEEVGDRLLRNIIAPSESGRSSALIAASSQKADGKTYYILEYAVTLPGDAQTARQRHNLSSITLSRGNVYTLSVSAPEERWPKVEDQFKAIVASFTVY